VIRGPLLILTVFGVGMATVFASPGYTIRYEIIDLGTFGGFSSVALGINNKAQIVGGADPPGGSRIAFLWENGSMTELPQLEAGESHEAEDINDLGIVVGRMGGNDHGFIWDGKTIDFVGDVLMPRSAYAINDSGEIVGSGRFPPPAPSGLRAFHFADDVMTDLGTLGGTISIAWDVNASGQIVGESGTGGPPGGAFLLDSGVMSNLGTLGGSGSEAQSINDNGQVVGRSLRETGTGFHAFLWEDGVMTDLGLQLETLAPFINSRPEAINNVGQVVGKGTVNFARKAGFVSIGFLVDPDAGPILLLDTLPENSGWSDIAPRDINDNGQIVGSATTPEGSRHAFLMNPLPPIPATSPQVLLLFAVALLVCGYILIGRRKKALG
jgi:probable HAF family extracellular repeat protein